MGFQPKARVQVYCGFETLRDLGVRVSFLVGDKEGVMVFPFFLFLKIIFHLSGIYITMFPDSFLPSCLFLSYCSLVRAMDSDLLWGPSGCYPLILQAGFQAHAQGFSNLH